MRLVVVIPTVGRIGAVERLLAHLESQSRLPDAVVISSPDASHIGTLEARSFPVTSVYGKRGLCAQRNQALDQCQGNFDLITFFDDDFIPADDYLERVEEQFEENADFAVAMGDVVKDGACSAGFSFDEGLAELRASRVAGRAKVKDHIGAYGCNMTIRAALIGTLRFDERLPLYGWQEDIDFTSQLRRCGRVVSVTTIIGVHLGAKAGRVSGYRLGYSQVVNPFYLVRKGTMPLPYALQLVARNVTANVVRSLWPEAYIDRRGRLRGNLLGTAHLVLGRLRPEAILEL